LPEEKNKQKNMHKNKYLANSLREWRVKNERTCEQRDHKNSVSDEAGAMDSFEQTVLSSAVSYVDSDGYTK